MCKHKKRADKVTQYKKGDVVYCTCKDSRSTKNRISSLVKTNAAYQRAWEAMGSQHCEKKSFIAKCHHAMGEHLSARFDKHICKKEH